MLVALRILVGLAGFAVVVLTVGSAIRTVVLPRGVNVALARVVFRAVRAAFRLRAGRTPSYERRDKVFAGYAPVALLALLQAWLLLTYAGFAGLLWAATGGGVRRALALSGSSLLTLGFVVPHGAPATALSFAAASVGLGLLALLISYLPSLYGAFSRREAAVSKLAVRAGSPPSGVELVWRAHVIGRPETALALLGEWESWFIDIEETHTSFPALVFFRSPQPDQSWVTAAGAILDGSALFACCLQDQHHPQVELVIRAGYLALRRISDYHGIRYPTDPQPGHPITLTRDDWEVAIDRLAAAGVPVRADRDQAWRDFAGWRVNYDQVLVALASLTQAPYAPWSSDRSLATSARARRRAAASASG
ncbi:MAG: hypothetical protein ACYDB7_07100 [Mycobacteriales bacterium]